MPPTSSVHWFTLLEMKAPRARAARPRRVRRITTTNSGASDARGAIHWIMCVRGIESRSPACSRDATNGSLDATIAPALQTNRTAIQTRRFLLGQTAIARGGPTSSCSSSSAPDRPDPLT